jgi:hypothetical protein
VWGTPPEPGTAELEPGEFLAYHYTGSDEQLNSILKDGVQLDPRERRPTEEGAAVWGSFQRPQGFKHYVEFKVRREDLWVGQPSTDEEMARAAAMGHNFTMVRNEIPADRITTWSTPEIEDVRVWQRELADATPEWKKSVLNGGYDGVPAVDKARQVLAREFGSPGWAEKPSGVPDSSAIKSASVPRVDTDRLQRRAARLRSEIDDPGFVYPNGRMGFRHRAGELTKIESELVKRGVLDPEGRRTSVVAALIELACRDASCAPPPVGTGGSSPLQGGRSRAVTIAESAAAGDPIAMMQSRNIMAARERVLGFYDLSTMNPELDPAMKAEYDALAKLVPVEEGYVRRGSAEAEALLSEVRAALPAAQVAQFTDVHVESVRALMDGVELYPEEVRSKIENVALGYTEDESHVAAFGPHSGGFAGPAASQWTLWFGPRAVRPAQGEANEGGASVMATVSGHNRHRIVGAHEMAHAVHNMAAEREWYGEGIRVDTRTDPSVPEAPTSRYGGTNTGERVAETFALAARDTFKALEPSQQELITSVLERAGLRPEQLDFAAEEREPYEVQFFGDDFGLELAPEEAALQAAGCQSEDCAPPPVGTGGSKGGGRKPFSKVTPLNLGTAGYDGELDPALTAYREISDTEDGAKLIAHFRNVEMAMVRDRWGGTGPLVERYDRAVEAVNSGKFSVVEDDAFQGENGIWALQSVRGMISATLKSKSPDPKIVELFQRMHEVTMKRLGGPDAAIHLRRTFLEDADGPFGGNAPDRFATGRAGDKAGTRVTSWADSMGNAGQWGTEVAEGVFGMDQVLFRTGSIPGEYLVAENPKVVERLMKGVSVAPFVRRRSGAATTRGGLTLDRGQYIDEMVDWVRPQFPVVAAGGCQSPDCAPPPVGTGGSKPGGGRVAELDSERIMAIEGEIKLAYQEIWDDIPDVIERAYSIQKATNVGTREGMLVEEAYQEAIALVDDGEEVIGDYGGYHKENWHESLRSVLSATMKSPSPDADVQVLLDRMHEATQQVFADHLVGRVELARSFDPVTDAADSMTGNERASSKYGSREGADTAPSSGVTSWAAYTAEAGDWGSEYVEETFPIEQVLMREGSIDGEFLVGESVERVREIVGR